MQKFKKGDVVIRTMEGFNYSKGQLAVVMDEDIDFVDDYVVLTKLDGKYRKVNWNVCAFMLYNVYRSPLNKALRENET
jgi:hypothetical protein